MLFLDASPSQIEAAAGIIRDGGVCAFPTETVYGLGADALNERAVAKIFEAKRRPFFDPLICHVHDIDSFLSMTRDVPPLAMALAEAFWPGPLTLVCRKKDHIPSLVTAGLPTVGVRIPSHPVALELIRACNLPVAAPSANPFGYLSPTSAAHVREQLEGRIDALLDGGSCAVGVESTIVQVDGAGVFILRPGGVSAEDIERITGEPVSYRTDAVLPDAPGQLDSHYAPEAGVVVIPEYAEVPHTEKCALLAFRENRRSNEFISVEILSTDGDLREAAANLFAALHRLDSCGAVRIYAEAVPETGLGAAIMNRLRKAAAPKVP